MKPDAAAFFAEIILMLPLSYFLLAAPGFLFFSLDIPPVARLLRGMFHAYFLMLAIAGGVGALALAVAGQPTFVIGIGVLAFAILARRWFLPRMDVEIGQVGEADRASGTGMGARLRRLHLGGMACNAMVLAAVASSVPYVVVAPG